MVKYVDFLMYIWLEKYHKEVGSLLATRELSLYPEGDFGQHEISRRFLVLKENFSLRGVELIAPKADKWHSWNLKPE